MTKNTFSKIAATIFVIVGTIHIVRVIAGWPLLLGPLTIPTWFSILVFILLGYLSWNGFKCK